MAGVFYRDVVRTNAALRKLLEKLKKRRDELLLAREHRSYGLEGWFHGVIPWSLEHGGWPSGESTDPEDAGFPDAKP